MRMSPIEIAHLIHAVFPRILGRAPTCDCPHLKSSLHSTATVPSAYGSAPEVDAISPGRSKNARNGSQSPPAAMWLGNEPRVPRLMPQRHLGLSISLRN